MAQRDYYKYLGEGTSHSVNCDDPPAPLLTVAAGYRGFVL
jgi:hypothetical protein